jgi:hypothetical protein
MTPFFVSRGFVKFTPTAFVSLLIVVAQGGPGQCAKHKGGSVKKATKEGAAASKAEHAHPESMSGALPRELIAALNLRAGFPVITSLAADDAMAAAPPPYASYATYQDLYLSTYEVSWSDTNYA